MNTIILIIGVPLSIIAAIMAFIITYEEYTHHYPDKWMPMKHGLETALVTFLFFIFVSLLLSFIFSYSG